MATKSNFSTIEPLLEIIEKTNVPYGFVVSNANQTTRMYRQGKDYLSEHGKILGTLNSTVKIQEGELNGLGICEIDKKHPNTESLEKIKTNILRTLKLKG